MEIDFHKRAALILQSALPVLPGIFSIYGAAGDPDPTFSQDGKILTSVGKGGDEARDRRGAIWQCD